MRVLVVEDYTPLRVALVTGLQDDGWAVDAAADGDEGFRLATVGSDTSYSALILDLMLPGRSGLQIVHELRAAGSTVPILLLTARDGIEDRVAGLDAGADDYLVKPFAFAELLARLRVITRRGAGRTAELVIGDLRLDRRLRTVSRGGERIELSPREFAILELLAMQAGEVVTRTAIWERTYDAASSATSNVVDVYIGYLRKKIERDGQPRLLHTHRGVGYLLGLES